MSTVGTRRHAQRPDWCRSALSPFADRWPRRQRTATCGRILRTRAPFEETASEQSEASHAIGASRRSGERERVSGSPRGEAPRMKNKAPRIKLKSRSQVELPEPAPARAVEWTDVV